MSLNDSYWKLEADLFCIITLYSRRNYFDEVSVVIIMREANGRRQMKKGSLNKTSSFFPHLYKKFVQTLQRATENNPLPSGRSESLPRQYALTRRIMAKHDKL